MFLHLKDPSYDPYGFAKIATRTASSEAGSAAACPTNVHKFFTTLFARAQTPEGLEQINTDLNLCRNSEVQSYGDVNATLAYYVLSSWVSAVSSEIQTPCEHLVCAATCAALMSTPH